MSFISLGPAISVAEVSNVSHDGFWLLLGNEKLFVPFADFPWFATARLSDLKRVERPSPDHLYWPNIDLDLSIESIRHPEEFPLKSNTL